MRRLTLREWLGSSVCAAVLMAGCNQAQRQPAYSTRPMGSVAMLPGYTPGTVFTTTAAPETAKPAMASTLPAPAPVSETSTMIADKDKPMTEELPPIKSAATPAKEVEAIPTVAKSTDSETTPAGYAVPVGGFGLLGAVGAVPSCGPDGCVEGSTVKLQVAVATAFSASTTCAR